MANKIFTGVVTSTKTDKTAVVSVNVPKVHPRYGKRYSKVKKYQVHDENNTLKEGDLISFVETKPLSKMKKWALKEVMNKGDK
jgi:small subunit ribosomal protein S17